MNSRIYQSNSPDSSQQYRPRVIHAVKTMPRWKWRLLGLALLVGLVGIVGQGAVMLNNGAAPAAQMTNSTPAPPGAAGSPHDRDAAKAPPTPAPTISQTMTPFMTRVGFSLFVGLIVGLLFRTFIRIALLFTALMVGGAMALSYFHVINLDLTAVQADTAQATNWLADQGFRLKAMLFHALPSSTSAGIGFIFGFKRR